ncbi:MAG: T9SS type A sorting domain-containing protein, partial [Bacteroidia bacterium]
YNAPIITNTTANNFEFPVSVLSIVSSENSFSLFPNPSTGVFTFKDTKNLNTVEVHSILGEKILSQTNQKTINLNGFSKGVYFARVNGMQVVKLVKE